MEDVEWGFRAGHANTGLLIHANLMLRLIPLSAISFEDWAGLQWVPRVGEEG